MHVVHANQSDTLPCRVSAIGAIVIYLESKIVLFAVLVLFVLRVYLYVCFLSFRPLRCYFLGFKRLVFVIFSLFQEK